MQVAGTGDKGAEARLVDDPVRWLHVELRPQREMVAVGTERGLHFVAAGAVEHGVVERRPTGQRAGVGHEPQVDNGAAGVAHRLGDSIDVRHDLARRRHFDRGARLHEAVLQVDDDMRGAARVEIGEHMPLRTEPGYAVQDGVRDVNRVHLDLSFIEFHGYGALRRKAAWGRPDFVCDFDLDAKMPIERG